MYHDFSVLTLMEGEQGYPLKLEPLIGDLRQAVLFSGGGLLVFLHLFLQPPSLKDNTAHRVPSYRWLLVLSDFRIQHAHRRAELDVAIRTAASHVRYVNAAAFPGKDDSSH